MHRLHENKIYGLGDVDAGVEYVHGNGDAWQVVLLELGDETVAIAAVAHPLGRRRDDLNDAHILWIHLLEDLSDAVGVFRAEGVPVTDLDFDLRAFVVEAVGGDTLLGESVAVLLLRSTP